MPNRLEHVHVAQMPRLLPLTGFLTVHLPHVPCDRARAQRLVRLVGGDEALDVDRGDVDALWRVDERE